MADQTLREDPSWFAPPQPHVPMMCETCEALWWNDDTENGGCNCVSGDPGYEQWRPLWQDADRYRSAILDIDAHATPYGTDDAGFVNGGYLVSVGAIHRALGVVGHTAPKCKTCSPTTHDHEYEQFVELTGLQARHDSLLGIMRDEGRNRGPYLVTRWTTEVNHADPCDCDEDNESVGNACMDSSEWDYMLCTDCESEWLRPLLRLPRRPPPDDHEADDYKIDAWPPPTGAGLIAQERTRQVTAEGFSPEHDRGHADGELIEAAYAYLRAVLVPDGDGFGEHPELVPQNWPWEPEAWKPTPQDPVRQLTKAGALIAAEIDRLLQA